MTIYSEVDDYCVVNGCESLATRKGLCKKHYDALRRGMLLSAKKDKVLPKFAHTACCMEGCERPAIVKGLCAYHYNKTKPAKDTPCSVNGCTRAEFSMGYCLNHYRRFKHHGNPEGGEVRDGRSKSWHADHHGYIVRYEPNNPHALPNGKVSQHRFVMGEHLGRQLRKEENVHHKNGSRTDNRIENLELWSRAQPAGQRVADKLAWAKEIIALYGNLDIL